MNAPDPKPELTDESASRLRDRHHVAAAEAAKVGTPWDDSATANPMEDRQVNDRKRWTTRKEFGPRYEPTQPCLDGDHVATFWGSLSEPTVQGVADVMNVHDRLLAACRKVNRFLADMAAEGKAPEMDSWCEVQQALFDAIRNAGSRPIPRLEDTP